MEEQEKQTRKPYIPAEQEVIESEPEWMFTVQSQCSEVDPSEDGVPIP